MAVGLPLVNLGWEPQWISGEETDNVQDWLIIDNMRGFTNCFK
jgi:hypothetical protein